MPSQDPPGLSAFFYPNLDNTSFEDQMVAKRFGIDAPFLANKETTLDPQYDIIFQVKIEASIYTVH